MDSPIVFPIFNSKLLLHHGSHRFPKGCSHPSPGGNAGSRVTALTWHGLNGLDEVIAGAVDGRLIFLQSSNLQSVATVNENSGGSKPWHRRRKR